MKKLTTLILMSAALLTVWSCQKEGDIVEHFDKPTDVVNPNPPAPPVDFTKTSLGELAAQQGIKLGTAFTYNEYFQNDQVAEILKHDFKAVTFGNEMKHDAIVSSTGKIKFDTADKMVAWAAEAGTELFGHVLGWHSQQQVDYLNGLISKASADNSASLLQDNWNFEGGNLDGYTASGIAVTTDYTHVFAGEYAAKADAADASISFPATLEVGKPYILSFWARADAAEGAKVVVTSGDNQKAETAVSAEWAKYSATFNTKSAGAFAFQLAPTQGVCIDNIRVIETEPEEEGDNSGVVYINPYALDGGTDFESCVPGADVTPSGFSVLNGAASVSITDELSNSGTMSLKLDNGSGAAANAWDIQALSPTYTVEPGKTYRIGWYGRANVDADIQIDIRLASGTQYKNSAWGQYAPMASDSWTYQYLDITPEEGDTEMSVAFYGGTAAATYYIDDFQVFEAIKEGDYTNYIDKTNLLVGADFEDAGAWGVWNGSSYVEFVSRNEPEIGANADYVHSALRALKVNNIGTGYTGGDSWHIQVAANNKVEVVAGKEYRIAMWVKSPDGATTIQYHLTPDSGDTMYRQVPGITDQWTYIYSDVVIPDGVAEVQLVLDCAYDEATYYIDDVQLMPKPIESWIDPNSILSNGDFEDLTDGFPTGISKGNGGEYISLSTEEAHSGKNSIKVDNTEPVGTGGDAWKIQFGNPYNTPTPLVGGKTYRYGVWVKSPDCAEGSQLQLYAKHYSGETAGTENYRQVGPITNEWTFIYTDIEVPDDEDGMYLTIQAAYAEGTFYFDDWQCFPIESSTASVKARKGFGKYETWNRPAPSTAGRRAVKFDSNAKLDGELANDAIGVAFKNYVYAMVEHFDVYAWDVINETFTEGGSFRNASNTTEEGHVFVWGKHYADTKTWVDKAFAYATDAASIYGKTPVLYINDYNLETSDAKRQAFCAYAAGNDLVTGVGTQMHLDLGTPDLKAKIEASLTDLVATGKMVRISELDIVSSDEAAQADMYKYIFSKYIEIVPAAQRGGITIWGINDKDSWKGEASAPLLWKGNKYEKKAAYEALYVYLCELNGIDPYQAEEDE